MTYRGDDIRVLSFFRQGLDTHEIARRFHVPEHEAYQWLHRVLEGNRRYRKGLGDHGIQGNSDGSSQPHVGAEGKD